MTVFPCKGSTTCAGYFGKQTWVYWTLSSWYEQNSSATGDNRELKQRRRQKSNRLRLAEEQLCTYITPFCTLLCRHCMATTWKCLISRIVKVVNTKQRLCFSFPELRHTLEFCSRKKKKCLYLTNWTRWNKRDKVWSSGTSLCNWRLRSRRRGCCLISLIIIIAVRNVYNHDWLLSKDLSTFLPQDILFDAYSHQVKKFILHTNFPGHYNFNMWVKTCMLHCAEVKLKPFLVSNKTVCIFH